MPRTLKPSDSWAALLAKELASVARPKDSKLFSEIRDMLKKAGLPAGESAVSKWIREQQECGEIEQVVIYERNETGKRFRQVYYVPTRTDKMDTKKP